MPICGDHFTRDIARGLCTTYEDAVRLKEEYGCAVLGLTADNSLIEVPSPEERGAQGSAAAVVEPDFGSAGGRAVPARATRTGAGSEWTRR